MYIFLFAVLFCLLSRFGVDILASFHTLFLPLCSPFGPSPSSSPLSGWNCGGGQLGLCRWPSSLLWWCSALTRCPLAAVTIGDRQVHRVLPQTPLPAPWEVNYSVTAKAQHMFLEPVAEWFHPILKEEEEAERGHFAPGSCYTKPRFGLRCKHTVVWVIEPIQIQMALKLSAAVNTNRSVLLWSDLPRVVTEILQPRPDAADLQQLDPGWRLIRVFALCVEEAM